MQSLTAHQKVIYREMAFDLCYRLRLFNDLFQKSASTALSAVATEDCGLRDQAVQILRQDSQALQLIAVDFGMIVKSGKFVFPAEVSDWTWELPNADELVIAYLERLQDISQRMEKMLHESIAQWETKP